MIDMYEECGNPIYARRIFDSMPERTVILWNVMLVGVEGKVKPDTVTYLAVLSGCSHDGVKDTGPQIFDKANIEHYGCIVDMLGGSGRLEQSLKFIDEMPYKLIAKLLKTLVMLVYE
ncbi:hypothetical protein RDABS01_025754 [Bienertia sinuspersici]